MLRFCCSYKSAEITVGETLEVYVTHVESPWDFWCQLEASSTTEIPLLMDKIQDYFSTQDKGNLVLSDPTVGMPCIAKNNEDSTWYRGQVTGIMEDALDVCFVDYGNSQCIERSLVKVMQPTFTELPVQAFHCSLQGIQPSHGGTTWDEAAVNRFRELANHEVKLTAGVQQVKTDHTGRIKNMTLTLCDDDVPLAQQLVDGKYAQFSDSNLTLTLPAAEVKLHITDDSRLDHETLHGVSVEGLSPIEPSTPLEVMPDEVSLSQAQINQATGELLKNRLHCMSMEGQGFSKPAIEVGSRVSVCYICGESPADFTPTASGVLFPAGHHDERHSLALYIADCQWWQASQHWQTLPGPLH